MNERSRGSARIDDKHSSLFETAHTEAETVDESAIVTVLARSERVDEADISVKNVIPTDNAGRPKSIVMGDCTVEGEDYVFELLANDRLDTSDVETSHHDDGTMSMSVGDMQEDASIEYVYETLDVRLFDK